MAETDLLSSLLADPAKLQDALSMASSFLSQASSAPAASEASTVASSALTENSETAADNAAQPVFASLLQSVAPKAASSEYDPSAELLQKTIPVFRAVLQSGQTAVTSEKRALLTAVKPFVTGGISTQIDHALRIVSMARMVRSAMAEIGGRSAGTSNDGTTSL